MDGPIASCRSDDAENRKLGKLDGVQT